MIGKIFRKYKNNCKHRQRQRKIDEFHNIYETERKKKFENELNKLDKKIQQVKEDKEELRVEKHEQDIDEIYEQKDKINLGIVKEFCDPEERELGIRDNNIKICRYLLNKEELNANEELELEKISNFFLKRSKKRDIIQSYSSDDIEEEKEHTEELLLFRLLERKR